MRSEGKWTLGLAAMVIVLLATLGWVELGKEPGKNVPTPSAKVEYITDQEKGLCFAHITLLDAPEGEREHVEWFPCTVNQGK